MRPALIGLKASMYTIIQYNWNSVWNDGAMFQPLLHIDAKFRIYCDSTAPNCSESINSLLFLVDYEHARRLSLNSPFAYPNIHSRYAQHVPVISMEPQLSRLTSLYGYPKFCCWLFWCFPLQQLIIHCMHRPLLISHCLILVNHFSTVNSTVQGLNNIHQAKP